jgi:NifU-like protein involved in Fe-S cluster formation
MKTHPRKFDTASREKGAGETLAEIYSSTVVDHCLRPRNFQKMEQPDGYASHTAGDGDRIEIYVNIKKGLVTDCTFQTNGCAATLACGSIGTELVKYLSFKKALTEAGPDNIIASLGGLPKGNVHCAHLVSKTLRLALADAKVQKNNPWKKLYRRI